MSVAAAAPTARRVSVRTPSWPRALAALVGRGLREQRVAILGWGVGLGLMGALLAAMWPSVQASMTKLVDEYPAGLKDAFGIGQLNTVEKYIDAEMLSIIVPLALAIFAVRCISRATVGAEDRGHLDTLLSLPVPRRLLVAASFIVTGLVLAAILTLVWAMTWIAGTAVGAGISATTLATGFANVWPLAMAFAGLAAFLGGLTHRPSTVAYVASATVVAMYVIDLAGKLSDAAEPFGVLSAFALYGSAIQDGLDLTHITALTVAAIALTWLGATLFERRDVL
jgi:ABC-2 type transport system permease protein